MENRFLQHFIIPCYGVDASMFMKPASFMDFAQEAANRHADIMGFGYDNLQETGIAWVLSRIHIRFVKHPVWRDEVDFVTWHKGPERLFYIRDFIMRDMSGNTLVEATSSWVVLNVATRRIVRQLPFDEGDSRCTDNVIEQPCDKVQLPADIERVPAGIHHVSYSDVDVNGHTNNAMYLVWAMDAVDYGITSMKPLKDVKINFNHETRPGDEVCLYKVCRETSDGWICHVEGTVEGRQAFCAELAF